MRADATSQPLLPIITCRLRRLRSYVCETRQPWTICESRSRSYERRRRLLLPITLD